VRRYGQRAGVENLTPHDLRRTGAHLALEGGAEMDQIQMTLGHASIDTTMLYLGIKQNLAQAPSDSIPLTLC